MWPIIFKQDVGKAIFRFRSTDGEECKEYYLHSWFAACVNGGDYSEFAYAKAVDGNYLNLTPENIRRRDGEAGPGEKDFVFRPHNKYDRNDKGLPKELRQKVPLSRSEVDELQAFKDNVVIMKNVDHLDSSRANDGIRRVRPSGAGPSHELGDDEPSTFDSDFSPNESETLNESMEYEYGPDEQVL
jgi:hypothetical protein